VGSRWKAAAECGFCPLRGADSSDLRPPAPI
jgi:hypothetical protein